MEFKDRLKKARKDKNYSQIELSKIVKVHVTNISRYERGETKPTSEVLSKLSDALLVSSDYLMSGSNENIANSSISDKVLLEQFKIVDKFSTEKKFIIKELLEAFIIRTELQAKFIA